MAHEPPVNATEDRLATIMRMQREFQEVVLGHGDLSAMDPKARADYFRTQSLSLVFELGEASNEIAWKPWATSEHFNREAFMSEMIDGLHFWINLALLGGMTPEDVYRGYIKKQAVNRARQREGYDGVTGKCPSCRRSYDDTGVLCTPTHTGPEGSGKGWCSIERVAVDTPVVQA